MLNEWFEHPKFDDCINFRVPGILISFSRFRVARASRGKIVQNRWEAVEKRKQNSNWEFNIYRGVRLSRFLSSLSFIYTLPGFEIMFLRAIFRASYEASTPGLNEESGLYRKSIVSLILSQGIHEVCFSNFSDYFCNKKVFFSSISF